MNGIDRNTYSQVFPFNDNISILTFLNCGINEEYKKWNIFEKWYINNMFYETQKVIII